MDYIPDPTVKDLYDAKASEDYPNSNEPKDMFRFFKTQVERVNYIYASIKLHPEDVNYVRINKKDLLKQLDDMWKQEIYDAVDLDYHTVYTAPNTGKRVMYIN